MKNLILVLSCVLCLDCFVLTVKSQRACPNVFKCGSAFTDPRSGNTYPTVQIGTQCWFAKNLYETKYVNSDAIPLYLAYTWGSLTYGAYCYNNNISGYVSVYGLLYNWYAVNDNRSLCPLGWYVPSLNEWNILIRYLGDDTIAGGAMKDTVTTYSNPFGWLKYNNNIDMGTNSSGFSALPGGSRVAIHVGEYSSPGYSADFWASSVSAADVTGGCELQNSSGVAWMTTGGGFENRKSAGASVRCFRDN